MRITGVSLQDFRNIALTRIHFTSTAQFIIGPNGQGKTNLLEAIGMIAALRSFRTSEAKALVRWGQKQARIIVEVEHEMLGDCRLDIHLNGARKDVTLDGEPLARLGDIIGRFPAVPLSSQDLQLLRGGPALRRRFIDLAISSGDSSYFESLRRYTHTLKGRNALLKSGQLRGGMAAFEHLLAGAATDLIRRRANVVSELNEMLKAAYNRIAPESEEPELEYKPDLSATDTAAYLEELQRHRQRDLALQSTSRGPHRDDMEIRLKGHEAREFASEGQQRGLVLALRLAQAGWLQRQTSIVPVILADDILNELDRQRRESFWRVLNPDTQVIATGTTEPDALQGRNWEFLQVSGGIFSHRSRGT